MAVTEQPTLLSRIGSFFRRSSASRTQGQQLGGDMPVDNDNGDAELLDAGTGGGGMLPGPIEPRGRFLRPWAKRDAAIEHLQAGVGALADLMTGIRENLERTAKRQDEMLQYMSHLPQALQQLPESARMQGEALRAIQLRMERQSDEQHKLADILERISAADQVHGKTLEGIQDRVDTLNKHDQAIAENLNEVGEAMQTLSRHGETSALVLKQLREDASARDGELERILHRQGSRFTTMLAVAIFLSIAALAAVGIIGYLMLNPPVR
jgi:hypothetical protein